MLGKGSPDAWLPSVAELTELMAATGFDVRVERLSADAGGWLGK